MAVMAAMAMAVPAIAADAPGYGVTIGGRVKADMGWQMLNRDANGPNVASNVTDSSITNFFASVNLNSYLRAMFTSADKTTGAHIEVGMGGFNNLRNDGGTGNATWPVANETVYMRFAYGWWKVGSCKLLVGQFAGRLGDGYYAGSNLGQAKSGKTDLNDFGFIGGTRSPKVALQMDVNDNFGFEVALGQAQSEFSGYNNIAGTSYIAGGASTNAYLPKLEVVFDFKFGGFKMSPGAGISYSKFKAAGDYDGDDSVLSYLLVLPMKYESGPFSIMLNGFYGQNTDTDWTGENSNRVFGFQPQVLPVWGANGREDTKYWGVGLAGGYEFTQQVGIKAGVGFANVKNAAWNADGTVNNADDNYTRWGAFIAVPYKLTSNFTIAPELAYYNYGNRVGNCIVNPDKADEWLLGVHFQFLF